MKKHIFIICSLLLIATTVGHGDSAFCGDVEDKTEKRPEKKSLEPETHKKTGLKLKLLGTVVKNGKGSHAVIKESETGKHSIYKLGEVVHNATILWIARKKVILNIDGERHVLEMESYFSDHGKDLATSKPSGSSHIESSNQPEELENIRIEHARLDESIENIHHLISELKVQPLIVDGKTDGLRLSRIKSNSILRELGLKNGDVIKTINGQKIESVKDAIRLYEKLQFSSSLELQLVRWGKEKTIQWNIEP